MTPYREILRLYSQGISQRSIAASCNCSRNTVARTIEKANEHNLTAPLPKELTDEKLGELLYPKYGKILMTTLREEALRV